MDGERRLGGRYSIVAELRRGPIAAVYQAVDIEGAQEVTVEVIHPRFQKDPRFVIRFREHLKATAALSHPNLVSILDYGLLEGDLYITTERIEGSNLRTYVAEQGALSPYQAVRLARQICAAVGEIHQHGLIHRDLKPETILLDADDQVKVTDIGLSSLLSESGLSNTDVLLDGVSYISPELARGEPVGPESDIYSIGIILFEMLTNRPPFSSNDSWSVISMHAGEIPPSPREFNPMVPVALSEIVERALQKTPDRRFDSARELEAALETLPQQRLAFWHRIPFGVRSNDLLFRLPSMLASFAKVNEGRSSGLAGHRETEEKPRLGPVLALQFLASFLISFVLLFAVTGKALDSATQPTVDVQRERTKVETYEIDDSVEALAGALALIAPPYAPSSPPAEISEPEITPVSSEPTLTDEDRETAVVNLGNAGRGNGNGGGRGHRGGKGHDKGGGKGHGNGGGRGQGHGGGKGHGKDK